MNRTVGDRILSLSATIKMPPGRWTVMRPHCMTCGNRFYERDGHRWPTFTREELRARHAQQLACSGGDMTLMLPLTMFWRDGLIEEPMVKVPPHCFLHEVRAEWDAAWRSVEAFGVQDLTRFTSIEPLDDYSYSGGR